MADLIVREFDEEGQLVNTASKFYPAYLDWIDIRAKAHWYNFMGDGDPRATRALLESQGQQLLINVENLAIIDHKTLLEKEHEAKTSIDEFIRDHGISRQPRNQ